MNKLYKAIGTSKQSFHQKLDRQMKKAEESYQMLPIIRQIRADHPGMGAREMYRLINPRFIGRDRFEEFCFNHGFKLMRSKSFTRTTNSLGVTRFENLIENRELTGVNQVWVSDITYYRIGERFYYLTFIMDLFSRKIVGHSIAKDLMTINTTIPALKMAIKQRKPPEGIIFHSDGGGQYYCKEFLKTAKSFLNSMAESVYENPHAERVNGTIKNYYLIGYDPQSFEELKIKTAKAVIMYNDIKTHSALNRLSPSDFEALSTEAQLMNKRKKVAKKEKSITLINYNCKSLKTVNAI